MNRNGKKGKAFTLVEALVVIFVIGTISSMMIVNWRKNEKQYQLQRTAQEIMQNIRKAQDYALNGKQRIWPPTGGGTMQTPEAYGIHFSRNQPTSYFIYSQFIGGDGYQNPEDIQETNTQLEAGIEIDSFGGGNVLDVFFGIPEGFVGFSPGGGTSATITIKRTGKTCPSIYCRNIIIRGTGEINIQ